MKNVILAYYLSFLWRSWFWLGVWILYYLKFTDYAGIGLLETIMITTAIVSEVPTGAVADMVGKKRAIVLAFLLSAIGNFVMAFAPSYWVLVGSIVTMTIGGAFYSGSMEALVYDTLKSNGKESDYEKALGKMTTMQNLGMAVAGVTGGFLYKLNESLPFLLVGIAYVIGVAMSMLLQEPEVDTEKFSWKGFVRQNKRGFRQLFISRAVGRQTVLLLIPGAIMVATENVLNDATALEYGFNSIELGFLATLLYLFGAIVSNWSDKLMNWWRKNTFYILIIGGYVISMLLTPIVTLYMGGLLLVVRWGFQTIYGNFVSVAINRQTESKYRATTLSTYALLNNIPYALGATGIGILMNIFTAKVFSQYLGIVVGLIVIVLWLGGLRIMEQKRVWGSRLG